MSKKKFQDHFHIIKDKVLIFCNFITPILVILGLSIGLACLTIYYSANHISLIIDKSISNFGSIGIPVLLIWIQYTYKQFKIKEQQIKEQAYKSQQQEQNKQFDLQAIANGESGMTYVFLKISNIFKNGSLIWQQLTDPEYQAKINGASEEEINRAKEKAKENNKQNTIESKTDTE